MTMFTPLSQRIVDRLAEVDLDGLTPREALNLLAELQRELGGGGLIAWRPKQRSMVVAGVMSGTSADGVDVALCRIAPARRKEDAPRVSLIGGRAAYPNALRSGVLRVMEGEAVTAAEMSRLNWRLGDIYADVWKRRRKSLG